MTEKEHKPKEEESEEKQQGKSVTISVKEFDALKEKGKQAGVYFDRLLRLQAEFDNTKKRLEKEKLEFIRFAEASLILELIPIMEDFERALESANKKDDIESLKKGIEIIVKHLKNLLTKRGLKEIETLTKPFDPTLHEALLQEEDEEHPENTITEEYQKGYSLGDKVLRHAKVKISKKKDKIDLEQKKQKEKGGEKKVEQKEEQQQNEKQQEEQKEDKQQDEGLIS